MKKKFLFKSEVWLYPGMAGNWHFVSLSQVDGAEIKKNFSKNVRGWGSLRVEAQTGKTKWETSIFPDKKGGTYILPIKALVRKHEGIYTGEKIVVVLKILV
jgi:hypothetical protein